MWGPYTNKEQEADFAAFVVILRRPQSVLTRPLSVCSELELPDDPTARLIPLTSGPFLVVPVAVKQDECIHQRYPHPPTGRYLPPPARSILRRERTQTA